MTTPLPVFITPNAADDLTASWTYLRDHNPRAADEWLTGIRETILGLGSMPDAHPIAPESQNFDLPIRRALYGKATRWRIYYAVIDEAVQILHVRHGSRSYWQP
ncbi:MAG: type II toxin-antitoxin system RelE/ParE family toxin [Propionivibrio sp.]|nr:type II toxin-antitoxin system RelE/ParE family toxin [Propionivibrio sp.]